jgi:hypothetical protein
VLLSLLTVRTNQIIETAAMGGALLPQDHPVDSLVCDLLEKIDQAKANSLVEKCLLWLKGERQSSVRLCGISFLRLILKDKITKISKTFITKYITGPEGCLLPFVRGILEEEW